LRPSYGATGIKDTSTAPGGVEIRDLDDLKTKLPGLTVIGLAVIFLGTALTLSSGTGILEFGAAVAFLIGAISAYLRVKHEEISRISVEKKNHGGSGLLSMIGNKAP